MEGTAIPFDSLGNYSLPAVYLAEDGTTILSTQHNTPFEDVQAGLNSLVMRSGIVPMSGPLKLVDGTVSAPALALSGSPTWGFYKTATGWGVTIGGVKAFEVVPTGAVLANIDIIGAASETTIAVDDTLPIYDLSETANNRMLVSDFLKIINALTGDATPESAADYVMTYDTSASAVKKVLLDNFPKGAQPPPGSHKNLVIKVTGNTAATVAADFVTMTDGTLFKTLAVSSTLDLTTTGVDALDAGTIASATSYALWAIAKPDNTVKCLVSTSFTSPTLPSGYTYKTRIGALRTASGSAQLYGTWQFDNEAQYVVGLAQTTTARVMSTSTVGDVTTPTWSAQAVTGHVPATASHIHLGVYGTNTVIAAPNASYLGSVSTSNPPPLSGVNGTRSVSKLMLESTNVYWANNGGASLTCYGWTDNI